MGVVGMPFNIPRGSVEKTRRPAIGPRIVEIDGMIRRRSDHHDRRLVVRQRQAISNNSFCTLDIVVA